MGVGGGGVGGRGSGNEIEFRSLPDLLKERRGKVTPLWSACQMSELWVFPFSCPSAHPNTVKFRAFPNCD